LDAGDKRRYGAESRFSALQRGGKRVIGWIVLGVLVLVVVLAVTAYNRLVELRNRYKNAFSQIDVQLKRRYDLIPNLVETAKGYLKHERQTLEAVIVARNQASTAARRAAAAPGDAAAMGDLAGAETALGGALGRMFALAEAYPDLKSNTTMNQLSEELSSTENKVAFARQAYNDAVMAYNTGREIFPASIIAGATGFAEARLWEIERAVEREAVKISFA
jgi:LemA protein